MIIRFCARIGVADEHDGFADTFESPVERGEGIRQEGEGRRRRDRRDTFGRERADHFRPARAVGPSAMDENYAGIVAGHFCSCVC
ncbi:MAG TPA: hypothetical protein VFX20_08315 [Steroidobacteraceae bacterium]|nr:hypothetical protein [Steroidobacteraceae bacterium]